MNRRASIVGWGRFFGALAALVLPAIWAAPAPGGWSAPRAVSHSTAGFGDVALATDARGDAALAWASEREVGPVRTRAAVHVAFVDAGARPVERTLWRSGNALIGGVAVALDARGELTVVWIDVPRGRNGATIGPNTVRAAYRTPSGKWSPVRIAGHSGPFMSADLRLATAPDREVLLTWRAHTRNAPDVAAAWRKPGHRFGPEGAVSRAGSSMMFDPRPLFDSGGAAHVYGTVNCTRVSHTCVCTRVFRTCATMVSTAPRSHRFGAPLRIAPVSAEFPVVSFSAPGRALIAWEASDFQDLEPSFAAPYARVLTGRSLSAPVALHPGSAYTAGAVNVVAANGGGGTVSWPETAPYSSSTRTMLAVGDGGGHFSAPSVSPDGLMPMLRDGVGNMLLKLGSAGGPAEIPPSPIAVRPAGGGAVQPSPMPLPPLASLAGIATTQPVGAGATVAWIAGAELKISTWRP